MKILEVIWRDAVGDDSSNWKDINEVLKEQLVTVYTVGYLISEKEDCLTLAMALEPENDNVGAYLTIPIVNIVEMRELVQQPMNIIDAPEFVVG